MPHELGPSAIGGAQAALAFVVVQAEVLVLGARGWTAACAGP